jgi:hypothetical protein
MINFFYGVAFMYLFAIPFLHYLASPVDEEDTGAPIRFAIAWPLAALEVYYRILTGDIDDDGTGST